MVMVSVDVPPGRMKRGLKDLLMTGATTGPKVILNVVSPKSIVFAGPLFQFGVNNPAIVVD